jgi:hypothetical protein
VTFFTITIPEADSSASTEVGAFGTFFYKPFDLKAGPALTAAAKSGGHPNPAAEVELNEEAVENVSR